MRSHMRSEGLIRLPKLIAVLLTVFIALSVSFEKVGFRYTFSKPSTLLYAEKKGPTAYQYSGPSSGPPPELAQFASAGGRRIPGIKKESTPAITPPALQQNKKQPTVNSKAGSNQTYKEYKKSKEDKKKGPDDDIDDLERLVLVKYGPNALRESLLDEEWDDEDEAAAKKPKKKSRAGKFDGFSGFGSGEASESSTADRKKKGRKDDVNLVNDYGKTVGVKASEEDYSQGIDAKAATAAEELATRPRGILLGKLHKASATAAGDDDEPADKKKKEASSSTSSSNSNSKSNSNNYSLEDAFDERPQSQSLYSKPTTTLRMKVDKLAAMTSFDDDYEGEERDEDIADDAVAAEEPRSGPLNAAGGFRLRRPPPVSPEEQAKLDAKAAALAAKDLAQQEKRKLKRELEKSEYLPFTFEGEDDIGESDQIFTSKTFADIGITDKIVLRNLERMGIFNPTKIQEAAVPEMLAGKDVVLYAQTGSGKTLSFLLPLLNIVDPTVRKVQAVVLAPSRELVTQIGLVGEALFKGTGINVVTLIGGANVRNQIKRLRDSRPQIVVATPGRLAELVFRLQKLRLGMVRAMVVDEVDNLLQDTFAGEVQTIFESTPLFTRMHTTGAAATGSGSHVDGGQLSGEYSYGNGNAAKARKVKAEDELEGTGYVDDGTGYPGVEDEVDDEEEDDEEEEEGGVVPSISEHLNKRLVCLASATGNNAAVKDFADQYLVPGWSRVSVNAASALPAGITHGLISTPRIKALELLKKFLNAKPEVKSALIFVNDPHRVEIVYERLLDMGFIAAPLHGDTSKDDRKEILSRLRDGRLNLVVTTELAARGIDIPDLTHVVNFELPTDAQHYVHRAGRCGRAGRKGLVMNFANPDTKFVIRRFGKQLGVKVRDCEIRDGKICLKAK